VDYSARIQTVDPGRNGRFYRLLKEFEARTGCAVLANTSFNVRGEPIVCSPTQAIQCFLATDMDALVVEDFLVLKEAVPENVMRGQREKHLARFEAD
jgi:carbamoyltransferase